MDRLEVPVWEKFLLTVGEAAAYFGIGEKRLRALIRENPDRGLSVNVGSKMLIKRRRFECFVEDSLTDI